MILALTESTVPLSVRALGLLLVARLKRERLDTYQAEMTYLLVKRYYKGVDAPSEVAERVYKPPTKPKPAKQIVADIKRKLG